MQNENQEVKKDQEVKVENLTKARECFLKLGDIIVTRTTWAFDEFDQAQELFGFIKANVEALTKAIDTLSKVEPNENQKPE
jgi:hypothetical protein